MHPVDALEHRALLVAAPVRAGDARELERRHLRRPLDVRPLAQVEKRALLVERHLLVLDAFDQLDLERLRRKVRERVRPRHLAVLERHVRLHARAHLLFDLRQIVRRQRARQQEVVVEAVVDRRPDRELRVREHLQHGLGHDVRGRVPHAVQPVVFRHLLQNHDVTSLPGCPGTRKSASPSQGREALRGSTLVRSPLDDPPAAVNGASVAV